MAHKDKFPEQSASFFQFLSLGSDTVSRGGGGWYVDGVVGGGLRRERCTRAPVTGQVEPKVGAVLCTGRQQALGPPGGPTKELSGPLLLPAVLTPS